MTLNYVAGPARAHIVYSIPTDSQHGSLDTAVRYHMTLGVPSFYMMTGITSIRWIIFLINHKTRWWHSIYATGTYIRDRMTAHSMCHSACPGGRTTTVCCLRAREEFVRIPTKHRESRLPSRLYGAGALGGELADHVGEETAMAEGVDLELRVEAERHLEGLAAGRLRWGEGSGT